MFFILRKKKCRYLSPKIIHHHHKEQLKISVPRTHTHTQHSSPFTVSIGKRKTSPFLCALTLFWKKIIFVYNTWKHIHSVYFPNRFSFRWIQFYKWKHKNSFEVHDTLIKRKRKSSYNTSFIASFHHFFFFLLLLLLF